MHSSAVFLADLSTDRLAAMLASSPPVVLLPVGSVEPHGPHLPLSTDTRISESVALCAVERLATQGVGALIAPSVPYGVTRYAGGFAGAVTVADEALVAFVTAVVASLLDMGARHVCVINNHLEPEHDAALRRVTGAFEAHRVSLACPLTRRWARTLSPEFKSGACHAGRYETSLVMAAAPDAVDVAAAAALPDLAISLSDGIRAGQTTFRAMGMDHAYTGSPRSATADEGRALTELLATMVVTEVTEALARGGA